MIFSSTLESENGLSIVYHFVFVKVVKYDYVFYKLKNDILNFCLLQ